MHESLKNIVKRRRHGNFSRLKRYKEKETKSRRKKKKERKRKKKSSGGSYRSTYHQSPHVPSHPHGHTHSSRHRPPTARWDPPPPHQTNRHNINRRPNHSIDLSWRNSTQQLSSRSRHRARCASPGSMRQLIRRLSASAISCRRRLVVVAGEAAGRRDEEEGGGGGVPPEGTCRWTSGRKGGGDGAVPRAGRAAGAAGAGRAAGPRRQEYGYDHRGPLRIPAPRRLPPRARRRRGGDHDDDG